MTLTSPFTLSESNCVMYKPHPRFLAQNLNKKVRFYTQVFMVIFTSCSFTVMSLMFLFYLIISANISALRINRYGDRAQPCHTPLLS